MNLIETTQCILDEENILKFISEIIFIKQQINALHLQNNTDLLDKAYDNIIMFKNDALNVIHILYFNDLL